MDELDELAALDMGLDGIEFGLDEFEFDELETLDMGFQLFDDLPGFDMEA